MDAAGNTSLGIDPIGFTGTPYNSRMNIRSTTGVNLTLDAPSDNISGPVLSFINKSGPNTISELGRIKTNNTGIDIFSVGKTNFDGAGDWTWNTPSAFQPLMELRKYQYSADLLVSARVGIGGDFTYSHKDPMAALDINISSGINGNNTEAISIAGTDPIIRIKNHAVEKGFIQLVGNDMKVGTFATNDLGNFVIRTNGSDRIVVRPDGKMVLGSPTGSAPVSNHLLAVKGRIAATEFTVTALVSWPDYVFAPGYQLKSLEETAAYIKANNHLPNIPAAEIIEKEGFGLGEMQRLMMEKIEELTLHLIEANREIQVLKKQMLNKK